MESYFTHDLPYHLLIFLLVLLLISISNIHITRRTRRHPSPPNFPLVSILVPARNEERSIARCVQSLLAQEYPSFEVLVLDDQSSDNTRTILAQLASSASNLSILNGEAHPEGMVGKNWACSQLAQKARGELLFFTDADTHHAKETLRAVVTAMMGEQADLVTGFPRQEVHTWGERLLVPFFSWALFHFIPLGLGYKLSLPILSSAVGQLMLFQRNAYQEIGGHEGVATSMVDDMSLARRTTAAQLRWRVVHVADLVSCRMYHSDREALDGFTKNLFAVFDYRLVPFLAAFTWLLVLFWEPLVILGLYLANMATQAQPLALAGCMALSFLLWCIHYLEMGMPVHLAFFYPLTILANMLVAFRSLVHTIGGRLIWKGRRLARVRWRWF